MLSGTELERAWQLKAEGWWPHLLQDLQTMVQETLCHVSPYVDASLPHLLPVMNEGSSCAMVQPPRGLQGILSQVQDRKIDPL